MRRGFTLVEIMVVVIILPFVMVLLGGLFRTILSEIPASYRIAQENTTVSDMLEQIQQDIDKAEGLPISFADHAAGDKLLLIELPDGVIRYELKDGQAIRTILADAQPDEAEAKRVWSAPHARIEWQVWTRDGERHAVQIQTYIEHKSLGRTEKKMANSHLYFMGAF